MMSQMQGSTSGRVIGGLVRKECISRWKLFTILQWLGSDVTDFYYIPMLYNLFKCFYFSLPMHKMYTNIKGNKILKIDHLQIESHFCLSRPFHLTITFIQIPQVIHPFLKFFIHHSLCVIVIFSWEKSQRKPLIIFAQQFLLQKMLVT